MDHAQDYAHHHAGPDFTPADPPFGTVRDEHPNGLIVEITGRQANTIADGCDYRSYRRYYALWTWDDAWATETSGSARLVVGAPKIADACAAFDAWACRPAPTEGRTTDVDALLTWLVENPPRNVSVGEQ